MWRLFFTSVNYFNGVSENDQIKKKLPILGLNWKKKIKSRTTLKKIEQKLGPNCYLSLISIIANIICKIINKIQYTVNNKVKLTAYYYYNIAVCN